MGSKSSKPTTTVQSTELPSWIRNQYASVSKAAAAAAAKPYQAYGGELAAPLNDTQQAAIGRFGEIQGIGDPYFQQGSAALGQASGYGQQAAGIAGQLANTQITPIEWSQEQLDKYMNPYQADVIKATMGNIRENNAQQMQGLIGNAISKGAWGGDRAGIAQAAMARQQDLATNQTLAQLNAQNYQQAMAQFNTQQAVDLQRQQANAALKGQAGSMYAGLGQLQAGMGSAYGQLGSGVSSAAINQAMGLLQAGTVEQQTRQAQDNAAYSQYMDQRNYPFQTLGWLANIYFGMPQSNAVTTSSQYAPAPSLASQLGGGLLAGLGALSDRRAKKDIKGLGQLDGQNVYRFKYKGDPENREHVGFMADEVEDRVPEAVSTRPDGLKQVNYALAMAANAADQTTRQKRAFGGGLGAADISDPTASIIPGVEDPLDRMRAATMRVESGGNYGALGPMTKKGDRAYGAYQVMGANIPSWTEKWAGRRMTPQEFLADRDAQDKVYRGEFGSYLNQFGPDGAHRKWFTGSEKGTGSDGYINADEYVRRAMGGGQGNDTLTGSAGKDGLAQANDGSDFKGGLGYFDKPGLLTGDAISGDVRMGLMQAGAAMLASRSPYAGQALGEGMLAGLEGYQALQKKRRDDALAQSQMAYHKGQLGLEGRRLSMEEPEAAARTAEIKQRTQAERWKIMPGLTGWQVIDTTNPQAGAVMVPFGTKALPDGTPLPPAPAASPGAGGGAGAGTTPPSAPAPTSTNPASESGQHYDPITGQTRPGMSADGFGAPQPNVSEAGLTPPDQYGNRYLSDTPDDLAQPSQYPANPQAFNQEAIPGLLADSREAIAQGREGAEKAQQTKLMAQQMRESMAILNSSRFTQGGASYEERIGLVKRVNDIYRILHKDAPWQNEEAAADALKKDSFRMGITALQGLTGGQREAGFMQQAGIGAVPAGLQSPPGQARLLASLEVQAQRQIDMQRFRENWSKNTGGDVSQADSYFNAQRPPSYYARKAVLLATPEPAVRDLMADPSPARMRQFDAAFGAGTARMIVGQH